MDLPKKETRPLLLLVGGRHRQDPDALAELSRFYRIWLAQPAMVTWEAPYTVGSSEVDTRNASALLAVGRKVRVRHEIAGAVSLEAALATPTAHLAHGLGLVGNTPAAMVTAGDRHAVRNALRKTLVSQPNAVATATPASAQHSADRMGYPVVLRPRGQTGDEGCVVVTKASDVAAAFATAAAASERVRRFALPVLVEEPLAGEHIVITAASFGRQCRPLAVTTMEVGPGPHHEPRRATTVAHDPVVDNLTVLDALEGAHAALGLSRGITHTTLALDLEHDTVSLVDIHVGASVEHTATLVKLATGTDLAVIAGQIAVGDLPTTAPVHRKIATVDYLYPDRDSEVIDVQVDEEQLTGAMFSAFSSAKPGDVLRRPPRGHGGYYGGIVSADETTPPPPDATDVVQLFAMEADQFGEIDIEAG